MTLAELVEAAIREWNAHGDSERFRVLARAAEQQALTAVSL